MEAEKEAAAKQEATAKQGKEAVEKAAGAGALNRARAWLSGTEEKLGAV